MIAQSSAVPGLLPSAELHMKPPGMPPGALVEFTDATSSESARNVMCPFGCIVHTRHCPFSPQQTSICPCTCEKNCGEVECRCCVLLSNRKSRSLGSCGAALTLLPG